MLRCDWTAAWATLMEAARAHGFDRPPPGGAMHRREEEARVAACNTLGLKPQPTHLELRKAYRALALAHHPDKLPPDATDVQREAAAARFNEVQEAHDTLMRIFGWAKGARGGGGGAGGDDGDGGGGGGGGDGGGGDGGEEMRDAEGAL